MGLFTKRRYFLCHIGNFLIQQKATYLGRLFSKTKVFNFIKRPSFVQIAHPSPLLFAFIFGLFQTNNKIFATKNVLPVSCAGIRTLMNTSLHP